MPPLSYASEGLGSPRAARSLRARCRRLIRRGSASLALRILLVFVAAALTPLVFSLVQTQRDAAAAEQRAFENARLAARTAALEVDGPIQDARQAAEAIRWLRLFWDGTDEDRSEILTALAAAQRMFTLLFYFTDDLQGHGFSGYQPGAPPLDVSDRAYAQEAVATGQLSFTREAVLGRHSGKPSLPIVVPVQEQALTGRRGYLGASLSVQGLPLLLTDTQLGPESSLQVVDIRDGRILAGTGAAAVMVNEILPLTILERIRAGESAFRITPPDGHERLLGWAPVEYTPWVVLVDNPSAAVFAPIYAEAEQRAVQALAVTTGALFLLILLWRQMAGRLGRLQEAATEWAQGTWTHRAALGGRDELGRLGRAFDRMAQQLQQDEAERLQAEAVRAQLATIVECSQDAIVSNTPQGIILSWNAGAERLFGYSAAEAIGRSFAMLIPPDRPAELPGAPEPGGGDYFSGQHETVRLTKDGRRIEVSLRRSPIRAADGTIAAIAVITRDITERKHAEYNARRLILEQAERARLEETNRALAEANRAKSAFLAVMSHELRTPLNSVIGFSELLLHDLDGHLTADERQRFLRNVEQSGQHLLHLVNDILDLTKVEAGRMELSPEVFDVAASLQAVDAMIRPLAEKKGLTLLTHVAAEVTTVYADEGRFKQVLYNLLSNAVKFTPEGGRVEQSAYRVDGMVEVLVADTGIGIAREDHARVFAAFEQVDSSAARRHQGTGLGLALTRRLVELQGGQIWLDSAQGEGSRFRFTIPSRVPPQSQGQHPATLTPVERVGGLGV